MSERRVESDDDEIEEEEEMKEKVKESPPKTKKTKQEQLYQTIHDFSDAEARRYEVFRRSHFDRGAIKRCISETIQECSPDKKAPAASVKMSILMAGITKFFVGEIITEARRKMEEKNVTGPIPPDFIREAYRKHQKQHNSKRRRLLR